MNFPEMIYELSRFFFNNFWTYIGLILIILVIRGDVSSGLKAVGKVLTTIKNKFVQISNKEEKFIELKKRKL